MRHAHFIKVIPACQATQATKHACHADLKPVEVCFSLSIVVNAVRALVCAPTSTENTSDQACEPTLTCLQRGVHAKWG